MFCFWGCALKRSHLNTTKPKPFQLLEANIRLKLSGPDYKDKDPVKSLEDFRQRVKAYESAYESLGQYEEEHDLQYIQVRSSNPVSTCDPSIVACSRPN